MNAKKKKQKKKNKKQTNKDFALLSNWNMGMAKLLGEATFSKMFCLLSAGHYCKKNEFGLGYQSLSFYSWPLLGRDLEQTESHKSLRISQM